jgi:hypothetical protein
MVVRLMFLPTNMAGGEDEMTDSEWVRAVREG